MSTLGTLLSERPGLPAAAPCAPELDPQLGSVVELRPAAVTFHPNEMPQARIRNSSQPACWLAEAQSG